MKITAAAAMARPDIGSAAASNIQILGPGNKPNPVVNKGSQITLSVVDANGQPISGATLTSGSPEIAAIDATGVVTGVTEGYATVTATKGSESASAFVVVANVSGKKGVKVMGQTEKDSNGSIYITDPNSNVVRKKNDLLGDANVYAGIGTKGSNDGQRLQKAQFAGPLGVAIDDRAQGGIYIADTLNHSVREVDFSNNVSTLLGTGAPGITAGLMNGGVVPFAQPSDIALNGPQGIAVDANGNLYIADTNNDAIYFIDLNQSQAQLLAGKPGTAGNHDDIGINALFDHPTNISLSPDGAVLNVIDSGNNLARQIVISSAMVTTLGSESSSNSPRAQAIMPQASKGIVFDGPLSISSDDIGNTYVVDKTGVSIVTPNRNGAAQILSLAQTGSTSYNQPASVLVRGAQAFVLDANADSDDDALKLVTVGAPVISTLSANMDSLTGGAQVVITGKNFAPESLITLGDNVVSDASIESATTIRFNVPAQAEAGNRTLTVQTRGGIAQTEFTIFADKLSQLTPEEITTVVGGLPFIGDGGNAMDASLFSPAGIALDGAGNLYVSDENNNRVRRITRSGFITTIAGNGVADLSGDGGPALVASLNRPKGLLLDDQSNLFIADSGNRVVRQVNLMTGIITTVAGNGNGKYNGDKIPAINAAMGPVDIARARPGILLIADNINNRIRSLDLNTGLIDTIAGTGNPAFIGDGGPALKAGFNPVAVAANKFGIFICDSTNNRIRRIDPKTGLISTVAGNGSMNASGDGGSATSASFNPFSVDVDAMGEIFISDLTNKQIRKVDAKGMISTFAGGKDDDDNIPANQALIFPRALAIGANTIFIAESNSGSIDRGTNRIRRVDLANGLISTYAGNGNQSFSGDNGLAVAASINGATGIAFDANGNLYIADTGNDRVRKVDVNGVISTFAGGGDSGGNNGDGGPADMAFISNPLGIAIDSQSNLFIVDSGNKLIRKVDAGGIITTVAGGGSGGDGSLATDADLKMPTGIAVDNNDNLYIAEIDLSNIDSSASTIKMVDAKTNIITNYAGNGMDGFAGDGGPAVNASLNRPYGLSLDPTGNLFIADSSNNRVRRVDAVSKVITTVAGGGSGGDGPATSAKLSNPRGAMVDGNGNIFISELAGNRVRRVDGKSGMIKTIVGGGANNFGGDDGLSFNAGVSQPTGLALDKMGDLFISDSGNTAIRAVLGPISGDLPPMIASVAFMKKVLTITGSNFSDTGAVVKINGEDVSSLIKTQSSAMIELMGSKKKLALKKGDNEVIVIINGVPSNAATLTLSMKVEAALE